ncbi:MAG: FAD-dependent monooxygenase [Candidatus Sericytochromatia bacterium]
MTPHTPDIAIVGAGIGGLSLALALQQQGHKVRIYEAAPQLKPVGAGLWLAPNGQRVLEALDPSLVAELRSAGCVLERGRVQTLKGTCLTAFDSKQMEARYGAPLLAIRRTLLHAALLKRLAPGSLQLGHAFVSSQPQDDGLSLTFANGASARADLLVGADGLKSAVRRQHWGDLPLRYSGQVCWRGLLKLSLPPPYDTGSFEIWGQQAGLRAGFSRVDAEQVYFYLTDAVPQGQTPPDDERGHLLRRFRGFPEPVLQLIARTPQVAWMRHELSDLAPLRTYVAGRCVLLGDAAHPMTPNLGQGANQALESAWVLAQSLKQSPDLDSALHHYEALRRPRASQVVQTAWRLGQIVNLRARPLRWGAAWAMAHLPARVNQSQFDRLFDFPLQV